MTYQNKCITVPFNTNQNDLSSVIKQKSKMKKNANEVVDYNTEKKNDPKYKTELCKSWIETKFCIYGNKCRFAHGNDELYCKPINNTKYKLKKCTSFFATGYCQYGSRCHFKHDERYLEDIFIPVFSLDLHVESQNLTKNKVTLLTGSKVKSKRLNAFEKICNAKEEQVTEVISRVNNDNQTKTTNVEVKKIVNECVLDSNREFLKNEVNFKGQQFNYFINNNIKNMPSMPLMPSLQSLNYQFNNGYYPNHQFQNTIYV